MYPACVQETCAIHACMQATDFPVTDLPSRKYLFKGCITSNKEKCQCNMISDRHIYHVVFALIQLQITDQSESCT